MALQSISPTYKSWIQNINESNVGDYIKNLQKDADINDFETISINTKNGEQVTLYRNKEYKNERDEKLNFRNSWEVFNSLL